jgi:phytoene desaturase
MQLLERDVSHRFSKMRLEHLSESCSTFMLYLGLDTQLDLGHHTFFFADDYRSEMERVFRRGELGDDFSLYVCNPVGTDSSVAPPGHSSLYALVLVPNTTAGIDWEQEGPRLREKVLAALGRHVGGTISPHVRAERLLTPSEWETQYQISHGAVFGPAHRISQLLAFRLPNQLPSPSNVFLTGGGTSPGSGLPTILESARIAARLLCERHGVPFPPSRPLPEPKVWGKSPAHRAEANR